MFVNIIDLWSDEGSVILFKARDVKTDDEYIILLDHRPAKHIIEALQSDQAPVIEIEPWQIVAETTFNF